MQEIIPQRALHFTFSQPAKLQEVYPGKGEVYCWLYMVEGHYIRPLPLLNFFFLGKSKGIWICVFKCVLADQRLHRGKLVLDLRRTFEGPNKCVIVRYNK